VVSDDDVSAFAAAHCPECPFAAFYPRDSFIKTQLPLLSICVQSADVANSLMWIVSGLFINARDFDCECHIAPYFSWFLGTVGEANERKSPFKGHAVASGRGS
jgi:hypothetical protein